MNVSLESVQWPLAIEIT